MSTLALTIIPAVILLLVGLLLMGLKAIFIKNGKFPEGHACQRNNKNKH